MSAPRTPRLDDFNRVNQGPAPSSSWTNGIITFTGGLVVLDNQLARSANGAFRQGSYWNTAFGPDSEVWGTVKYTSRSTNDGMSLYTRLTTPGSGTTDGYALLVEFDGSACQWGIQRFDNGVGASLGSLVSQDISDGDQVLFQAYGDILAGFLGSGGTWAQVVSASDSTYTSAGFVGVDLVNGQRWRLDDFGGGTFPASGAANATIR